MIHINDENVLFHTRKIISNNTNSMYTKKREEEENKKKNMKEILFTV